MLTFLTIINFILLVVLLILLSSQILFIHILVTYVLVKIDQRVNQNGREEDFPSD